MYINKSGSKETSLYHYALFLLGLSSTDTTSYPTADFMRSANSWYRNAVFIIWKNTSAWEFDDSNYTTLPIATTTIVNNQQDYALPTNALDVERVEVLDINGNYQIIKQITKSEIRSSAMSEYYETAGMPVYYDVIGNSLVLYPKPSTDYVTAAAGFKVYLARDVDAFDITDTDQEPGILSIFHPYIAYGATYDYAVSKNISSDKVVKITSAMVKYEDMMKTYYAKRNLKELKTRIKPSSKSSL